MAERILNLEIVTPDRVVLRERVQSVTAPGAGGSFGVLPFHAPLLAELGIGEFKYRSESGQEERLALGCGFFQVFNNQITVLADTAERATEIDVERARAALAKAKDTLAGMDELGGRAREEAQAAYDRAQNRIRVAQG
jgi:F-type H+-transporting ATPase subunit epsilon